MQMVDDNVGIQMRQNAVQNLTPAEGNGNGIHDAHEETKRVKVSCTLEDTFQQASTSGTQTDNALVYDTDGSAEDMNSRALNKNADVSNVVNLKKHKPKVRKPKRVGSKERLALPKPSKPRSCLRWSPTRRLFDHKGKIIASSESESQSNCSIGDNACT
nr:hypothetical protein [Tanacetum cinerariifolium]